MTADAENRPRLHHFALDPFCRRVRLTLGELGVAHDLVEERPWLREERLLALNPAGEVPVLVEPGVAVVAGIYAVTEYIEERFATAETSLLGKTAAQRAEVRRLLSFLDGHLYMEVSAPVLMEKGVKRLLPRDMGGGAPDTNALRAARERLGEYLALIGTLSEARGLLAGPELTLADLAAAAHLSVLEYLDALRFDGDEPAKIWYQRIKSRPSFKPLLGERVPGITPPAVYGTLDF